MRDDRIVLPRLLEPTDDVWNKPLDQEQPVTASIEIDLPITPESLKDKPDYYVMYAAYYVRQHCPEHMQPSDVEFQAIYKMATSSYLQVAKLRNKALGNYETVITTEVNARRPALDELRRMQLHHLEGAYSNQRRAVLKVAIDRHLQT